jgi:predicted SnoaL-like aldol condensation-catalyzing enzyme
MEIWRRENMKLKSLLMAGALLAAAGNLAAQEPVVGVDDPEALFAGGRTAEERRNLQSALHIMRELLQCNQWDRAGEWITDRYLQHNPNAASGLAGVVYYFTEVLNRPVDMNCTELTTEVVAVMAQDDLVTVIMPRSYPDPRNPGQTYSTTWFDTWRFVDGKADEHWDPAQVAAP